MILVMYTVYAPLFYIEVVASLEIIYTAQKKFKEHFLIRV